MSKDMDKLEAELDEAVRFWGPRLDADARPSPAALARTKAAVNHALNERWLTGVPTPLPSKRVLARVRSAVHAELAARSAVQRRTGWSSSMVGSLAAAAMIALCFGLVHRVGSLQQAPSGPADPVEQNVSLFVEAASAVLGDLEPAPAHHDDGERVLQEFDQALKDVLDAGDEGDNSMGLSGYSQEAVG